jgi:sporulation protein YlmC with PRC-barrel domain
MADYDRYGDTRERERTRSYSRRGSIFGRSDEGWGDRDWRGSDGRRATWATERGRSRYAYSGGRGRDYWGDRPYGQSEARARREEDYGPDDWRGGLPRDETSHLIASNKVEGTAVYGRDGERLGTIYNFMVDKRSGRVEYAVMSFGGFLGMGTRYYPVPWDMLTYDTREGGYHIDMTERDLEDAPSFDERSEPVFNRAYGSSIYGFYGIPY